MASETDVNEGQKPTEEASQEATNKAGTEDSQKTSGANQKRRRPRSPRRQYHGPKRPLKKPIELRSQVVQDVVTGFRYSEDDGEYQPIDYLSRVAAACQQLDSRLPTIASDNKTIKKIERALWAQFDEAQSEMRAARAAFEEQLLNAGADPDEEVKTMEYEGEPYVIEGPYVTPGHRRFLGFLGQLDELIRLIDAAWFEQLMTNEEHSEKMLYWRKRGREVSRSISSNARAANNAHRNPNPDDEASESESKRDAGTEKEATADNEKAQADAAKPKEENKAKPKGKGKGKGAAQETAEEAADEQ